MASTYPNLRADADYARELYILEDPRVSRVARSLLAALDSLGDWSDAFPREAPEGGALTTPADERLAALEAEAAER